jgi:lipoprotein-anchoring transpeptidase ErfK/SrfK
MTRQPASDASILACKFICFATQVLLISSGIMVGAAPAGAQFYGFPDRGYHHYQSRYYDPYVRSPHNHSYFRSRKSNRNRSQTAALPKEPFGQIPAGPLQIMISLERQRLSLFSDGKLVAQSPISTGVRQHPTPTGIFSVIQKQLFHRSNIYSDAPMPYMQRITWSGIAIHEGVLPGRPASHGCIRLPHAFATRLYALTRLGARVIVTRNEVAPVEFEQSRLLVRKQLPLPELVTTDTSSVPTSSISNVTTAENQEIALQGGITAPLQETSIPKPVRNTPITVFVSRKEGKLYVREGFKVLFSVPVVISEPTVPFGTHIFTAMDLKDESSGTMRWTVVSLPDGMATASSKKDDKDGIQNQTSPSAVLDRLDIPQDVTDRISAMMSPGSSLIVSDHGLGAETGTGTDFVVVTR